LKISDLHTEYKLEIKREEIKWKKVTGKTCDNSRKKKGKFQIKIIQRTKKRNTKHVLKVTQKVDRYRAYHHSVSSKLNHQNKIHFSTPPRHDRWGRNRYLILYPFTA